MGQIRQLAAALEMQRCPPPRPSLRHGLMACAGIFFGISVLAFASFDLHVLLALGSFGSTSLLLFAFPDNQFSQPRSIIGGHVISSASARYASAAGLVRGFTVEIFLDGGLHDRGGGGRHRPRPYGVQTPGRCDGRRNCGRERAG